MKKILLVILITVLTACAPQAESAKEIVWSDVAQSGSACTDENFTDGYLLPGTFLWRPVNPDLPMTAQEEQENLDVGEPFEIPHEFVAKTEGVYEVRDGDVNWINDFPAYPEVEVHGITLTLTNATCVPASTIVIDSVGQVFKVASFEPPVEKHEYIEMSVQQMVPGLVPFSKWDWGEFYTTHLDPTSIAAWGDQIQEDCEVTGTEFSQELAYNSVTWTGVASSEEFLAGLDGTYIHFKAASLTDISMKNSLTPGSCYSDLFIRSDLVVP